MADADLTTPAAANGPRVLVCAGLGINTEREMATAFRMVGAAPSTVHVNDLATAPERLDAAEILAVPGGFSYGDHLGSGAMLAARMTRALREPLQRFCDRGGLVLGVCNGFQVLVRMGMLPASAGDWQQEVALVQNDSGQFVDRWVTLDFDPASPCVWTRGLRRLDLPIRHGEGRMVAAGEVLDRIDRAALAPVRYVSSDAPHPTRPPNPNGSQRDIAGLCDSSGNVFGLMPHPEAFLHRQLHPLWRRDRELTGQSSDALQLFRNAVEHVRARR